MAIEKVAVLGAGVMGAGIAAHVANAGVAVVLLDLPAEGDDRSAVARGALERLAKAEPAAFMLPANAKRVTVGNFDDDLGLLADADWIVEAVVERADVKRALYERVESVRKDGSIVSSNTSTIPLADLMDGMPERLAADFVITHFFNPPRYMRLLELVAGPATRAEAVGAVREFCDVRLGKGVVDCHDTPGFIGNRIGIYWLQRGLLEAFRLGLTVEEADAVLGRPVGVPKTGVFGLLDLVGIDLMPHVLESMRARLPAGDAMLEHAELPPLVHRMIAEGFTGRKGRGGFYRLHRENGRRTKLALDLSTGEARPAGKARLESLEAARARGGEGLRALLSHPDRGGRYAWAVMSSTIVYAASLVPEIADDVQAVDAAMRLGYNWRFGPFELADRVGAAWLADRLREEGREVPALLGRAAERGGFYRVEEGRRRFLGVDGEYHDVRRAPGVLLLEDVKLASEPVAANRSASLWDLGDGVACLEFHTKMNAIDPDVLALARESIRIVGERFRALVVYNEGEHFSVGVNLGLALFTANVAGWSDIEGMVALGQETYRALRRAPFPVVGAPSGMALGGGCEILLHCDAVEAHAETYMGLVEVGVGLIPAWGGCKEMLRRWHANPRRPGGPMPPVSQAFETIGLAKVARSADEARGLLFLRPDDGIVMNRDRVLAAAKRRALALAEDYAPPEPAELTLPGPTGRAAIRMALDGFHLSGRATDHDVVVGDALATVLSGGESADLTEPVGEDEVLALERAAFMRLVREPATLARMEHMLETGKPLRN